MPWQITTVIFVLLSSSRAIQNRRIGLYKSDVSLYASVASFTCLVIVAFINALLNWDTLDHSAALNAWPFLICGGVLFASFNIILFKLFRHVPASIMTFTTLLNTVSVLFFAIMFGGESISAKQVYGAIILFLSVALVGLFTKREEKAASNMLFGFGIVLFSALLFGPAIMNEKYLMNRIGFDTYILYGWCFQALSVYVMALILMKKGVLREKLPMNIHINVWIVGALLGLTGLAYVSSLNNSGSASTIALSGTAVIGTTVFLAYFILKEKKDLKIKILGIALSGVGLILLLS